MGDAEFSLTLKAFTIQAEENRETGLKNTTMLVSNETFLFCGKNKHRSMMDVCGPLFCLKVSQQRKF